MDFANFRVDDKDKGYTSHLNPVGRGPPNSQIKEDYPSHIPVVKTKTEDTQVQSVKIIEKVSFNIASEASYVYILISQKLIKNAKIGQFGEFLK